MMRFIFFLLLFATALPATAQLYVAVDGNDRAAGTKEAPLATPHAALRKVREMRRLKDSSITNAIHIFVGQGVYRFAEPLFVRQEDAGTAVSPTIFEALTSNKVVFSGGVEIRGWTKAGIVKGAPSNAQGKVWVADAPVVGDEVMNFRQLWVNNEKAIRAKDRNGDSMNRILSWDHKTEECWIPKPTNANMDWKGVEFTILQWWAIANLRIRSADVIGDRVRLRFYQPESRVQSEHPWPAPWQSKETGNSAFYLSNALAFLDEPGEWFLDKAARKIYYWPRSTENMATASVVVPAVETLVRVEGTTDHPVTHLQFKNISFQHTTWLQPSEQGHVPHQVGMYMLDAYKLKKPGTPDKQTLENQAWVGRPAAAVKASFAKNISFEGCRFEQLASSGLDLGKGVVNAKVNGNLFRDIGGNAIVAGHFSDEASEIHLPYNPTDSREVSDSLLISNNVINNAGAEDWGCVGIAAGYIRNSSIEYNDISELPYMGISQGWGWSRTPNVMRNNRIHANKIHRFARQLYDVSGIYTLSSQPNTIISANWVDSAYKAPYAHLPSHWFYLYTDEGSSYITVKDNWTPSQKFLQNANGPGNVWANNGPMVAEAIKNAAGLEPAYQHLLKDRKIIYRAWGIAKEQPVMIELVKGNEAIDVRNLRTVLAQNKVDSNSIYQWQDHYAVFAYVQDVSVLRGKLENAFPSAQIKVYYEPFYDYNRSYCGDTSTAREWDHVILTANLVADPKLQQEYMDYHATQFQKWPELSKGFCNASFQRLLIYRNGRQLMLVISIPKGKSLDELNPKTTENNPRVAEWNKRMARYQEGIEGAKPGETWVFLKQVTNK